MTESVEVRLSNYQIEKAIARLAYQRGAVSRLGFDANPYLAKVAKETLASMQDRLAALLVRHADLLAEQGKLPGARASRRSDDVFSGLSSGSDDRAEGGR